MSALYTLTELGLLKDKVAGFRSLVEKGETLPREEVGDLCGDIILYLRRRFPQSSKAKITKEEMQRIYDYAKNIQDNFDQIEDYFDAFNKLFLLIVEVERLATFPKNGEPASIGI